MRAERRKHPFPSSPIQQNSLEQAGNITHAGNKALVVSWALGELGGELLFLSRKASGGCFFLFVDLGFFSVLTENVNETRTVPRKMTYTDELISCLGEVTMEIVK